MRKRTLMVIFVLGVSQVCFVCLYIFRALPKVTANLRIGNRKPKNSATKFILVWNDQYRIESGSEFDEGPDAFIDQGCHVTQCRIVRNQSVLPLGQYDAIVFNMLGFKDVEFLTIENGRRQKHQRYVFLSQEPPNKLLSNWTLLTNFFNWSMTYRLDSDIHLVYGRVHARLSAPGNKVQVQRMIEQTHSWSRNYAWNKTKSVVWMASNCEANNRETYVKELSKYIDVDIYGSCGNLSCPRHETHWISHPRCYEQLSRTYRFYLSFENSACKDYVTEKFYEILARDLVPVVLGGANYELLAPPHSFIDASNYTPRQLARYLHRLVKDDKLYNEYFWWKDHYEVEAGAKHMARRGFCDLCRKLHEDSTPKVYDNVRLRWNARGRCARRASWTHSNAQFL